MLLTTKIKNEVKKEIGEKFIPEFHLRNTRINGVLKGCSGHIVNADNGSTVYVNTEESCLASLSGKVLVRYALSPKDFSSNNLKNGFNQFVETEKMTKHVVKMLLEGKGVLREARNA